MTIKKVNEIIDLNTGEKTPVLARRQYHPIVGYYWQALPLNYGIEEKENGFSKPKCTRIAKQ